MGSAFDIIPYMKLAEIGKAGTKDSLTSVTPNPVLYNNLSDSLSLSFSLDLSISLD